MNIKPIISKYLPKAMGIAALCVVASDAHVIGKLQSNVMAQTGDANAVGKRFHNTQFLNTPSVTTSKLKKAVFRLEMEDNTRNFVNSALGYVKGVCSMLVSQVVPFTLGLGALLFKKGGTMAKGSAIGLGIYGLTVLFKDVLGLGHSNDLNKNGF